MAVLNGTADSDFRSGTERADQIAGFGGNDHLFGGGGRDSISGGNGDDTIDGGEDGDILRGDAGRDLLIGGGGRDSLDGGAGIDVAWFSGKSTDYRITRISADSYFVADLRRGSAETDELKAIERLYFAGDNTTKYLVANRAAVARNDIGTGTEDSGSPVLGNVLANDSDADLDAISVAAVRTGPQFGGGTGGTPGAALTGQYGSLTLNANGSYSYFIDNGNAAVNALNAGHSLTDFFTYTIADGNGGTSQATLSITVNGVNDTPVFTVIKDASNVVTFTSPGSLVVVTEAGGTFTFTSSGGTAGSGTAAAPIAGIVAPGATTLSISSLLASGVAFTGAGTALVIADTDGEDLTAFTGTGVDVFELTAGQNYTLTVAQAAIARIGASGTAGALTDPGIITIKDNLDSLGAGVAAALKAAGADVLVAIAATSADISGIDVTGIDSIVLGAGQSYTVTADQAALVDGSTGAQTVTFTTLATGVLAATVESFILGDFANDVTLGTASQNVTGPAGYVTVLNIGGDTATGTWALANGADVLVATTGADIAAVNGGGATTAEKLTLTGAITMTQAQHEALAIDAAGSDDSVTITSGGAVTAQSGVESYTVSAGGSNSLTVLAGPTAITGSAANATTVAIGGNTVSGTWALAHTADEIVATDGANIAAVNGGAETTAETLTLTGAITMTRAQHEALAIDAGGGSDAVTITTGGSVTGKAGVEKYSISSGGSNTLVVIAGATDIEGSASNATTVDVGGNTVSGTWTLAHTDDIIVATDGANIAGVNGGAETTAANLTLTGATTMTQTQHEALTIDAAGGSDAVTITTGGSVTGQVGVEKYSLSSGGGNTLVVIAGATDIQSSAGNATTVDIGGNTVSGTWALAHTSDKIVATSGADIAGVNAGGATTAEALMLTGAITMTQAQHEPLAIDAAGGSDAVTITTGGTVTGKAGVEKYLLSSGDSNTLVVIAGATDIDGSAGNATTVDIGGKTVSGTWALAHTNDEIVATTGANIAGVNGGGATMAEKLTLTGAITMTQAQYGPLTIDAAGSSDAVTITTGGAVTGRLGVEKYSISSGGSNLLTVLGGVTAIDGSVSNATTVNIGGNMVSGTWALANANDKIVATNGANITGVNAGGATTAEAITLTGAITMTRVQHEALIFDAVGGTDAVTIATGGLVTRKIGVEKYSLSSGSSNTLALIAGSTAIDGSASNATTVDIGGNTVSGTWDLAHTTDKIIATSGANIAGVNAGGATTAEELTLTGAITMTQAQHAGLAVTANGGADSITVTDGGDVAAKAGIETYTVGGAASNVTVNAATTGVSVNGGALFATTVTIGGKTVSGTYALASTADVLVATTGANIASAATSSIETLSMSGDITMTAAQYTAFNGKTITAAGGSDRIILIGALNSGQTLNAAVENFTLAAGTHSVVLGASGQFIDASALGAGVNLTLSGNFAASVALTAGNLLAGTADGGVSVSGGTGANTIVTGSGADTITAGDGADTVSGGDGLDTLNGGNGNDVFLYSSMAQFIAANQVIDLINGGADTDAVVINSDSVVLTATSDLARMTNVEQIKAQVQSATLYNHSVVVNNSALLSGVNTIDLSGDTKSTSTATINFTGATAGMTLKGVGAGTNVITAGLGADALFGGTGNDRFVFGSASAATGDTVTGGGGTDTVLFTSTAGQTLVLNNNFSDSLSYLITTDTTGAKAGTTSENIDASARTGGSAAVTLTGNAGNNVLTGSQGADTLTGGGGIDIIRGGPSSDLITAASAIGSITYVFEANASANGSDTLMGVRDTAIFDFSDFLDSGASLSAIVNANDPAVWLNLSGASHIGARYGTSSLSTTNIVLAYTGEAGQVVIADNSSVVVFSFGSQSAGNNADGTIYYVRDVNPDPGLQAQVFMVGTMQSSTFSITGFAGVDFI